MIVSSLAYKTIPAHLNNYWGDRKGAKVNKIILHHMCAKWTAQRCGESFQDPNRGASSNYGIGYEGEIACYVAEDYCAGTSGGTKNGVRVNGFEIDRYAITIECANSIMKYPWNVSNATLTSIINLCTDIARRYNFGKLEKGKNLCWHQMYASTDCPGEYLLSKMDYICQQVNKRLEYDTSKGFYTGFNVARITDALCVYIAPLTEAPTNKWGHEVACDKYGVAICNPVYGKGHMKIPAGGRVFSGHGKGSQFVYQIKKGYKVWIQDGRVFYDSRQHLGVNGVNRNRGTNELIVYNNNNIKRNVWGCEVAVDKNGIATNTPVYGKCNLAIPSGGFVLSGHGDAAWWMLKYIKKGTKITYSSNTVALG